MADKLTAKLASMAGALLTPGETPEHTLLVQVGKHSAGKRVAAAALGAFGAVGGAIAGAAGLDNKPKYVLVTDRQLVIFSYAQITSLAKHLGSIGRADITGSELRKAGLQLKLRLDLANGESVELGAKPLPPKFKRRLRALAESLGAGTPVAA
jgi:hypothetical protein